MRKVLFAACFWRPAKNFEAFSSKKELAAKRTLRMRNGFSLAEILISIAIMSLLAFSAVYSFSSSSGDKYLDKDSNMLLSLLDRARSSTLSGNSSSQYGVNFTATSATLFMGASYVSGAAGNEVSVLDNPVRLTGISLAGSGSAVVFTRLTGKTSQNGTLTLSLVASTTRTRVITVYATGISELNKQ